MKKLLTALVALVCLSATAAPTPDIRDLLGGLAGAASGQNSGNDGSSTSSDMLSGALGGLVQGLLGNKDLTAADIAGVYKYSQPAITFKSDNLLQKAGGAAMAAPLVNKLAPYYQKAGLENLEMTLTPENTFQFKLKRISLSGTFNRDSTTNVANQFVFSFKALGGINIGHINADVQKNGNSLIITFDASKLLSLVNTISKLSGQSTLQAAASLLNSYDGLNCGFSLTKTADVQPTQTSQGTNAPSGQTPAASDSNQNGNSQSSGLGNLLDIIRKK